MRCRNCGISLDRVSVHCDVCSSILDSIEAQPGLVHAALEYQRENIRLTKFKAQILGQDTKEAQ